MKINLKIETDDDLLLITSSVYFQEFSYISYNKNIDIKQNKNILNIKFNTTKYNSKLEYNIALIDEDENIKPITILKKFFENNLVYKNIIHSTGIEQIETSFSLRDNFTYDKKYTIIAYGKEYIGESFNYFYLEPKTLLIIDHTKTSIDNIIEGTDIVEDTNNIINKSYITNIDTNIDEGSNNIIEGTNIVEDTNNIINESYISYIDEGSDNTNITKANQEHKSNKISTLVIIIIVLACIIIIGGIIFA